jgi:hypothetical protein
MSDWLCHSDRYHHLYHWLSHVQLGHFANSSADISHHNQTAAAVDQASDQAVSKVSAAAASTPASVSAVRKTGNLKMARNA